MLALCLAHMRLDEISAINFRSYDQLTAHFSPGLNALVGPNGAGKTNVLDMVYYLSMGKPPSGMPESSVLRHDAQVMNLFGRFAEGERTTSVGLAYQAGTPAKKQLIVDEQPAARIRDHVGRIPLAVIYPNDALLMGEGGDLKRRFMNFAIAQYDPDYLPALTRFEQVLAQRNAYLKLGHSADPLVLEAYDAHLVPAAQLIYQARHAFCQVLAIPFQAIYSTISQSAETVDLTYTSSLGQGDYAQMLAQSAGVDRQRMHTTIGIHRDTITFTINGYPACREGSQGQQKSFVIALRLAQHQLLRTHCGGLPILLLDDLLDRLDAGRAQRLLRLLAGPEYGQVFLTHCDAELARTLLRAYTQPFHLYRVEPGIITLREE